MASRSSRLVVTYIREDAAASWQEGGWAGDSYLVAALVATGREWSPAFPLTPPEYAARQLAAAIGGSVVVAGSPALPAGAIL